MRFKTHFSPAVFDDVADLLEDLKVDCESGERK